MDTFFAEHQSAIFSVVAVIMSALIAVMSFITLIDPFVRGKINNYRKKSLSDDFLSDKYNSIDDDILYRYLKRTYNLLSHEDYVELLEEAEKEIIDKQNDGNKESVEKAVKRIENIIKAESEVKPFDGIDSEAKAFFEGVTELSADSENKNTIKTHLHELAKIFRKQEKGLRRNKILNGLALAFSIIGIFVTVCFAIWGKSTISEASIESIKMDHSSEIECLMEWISATYPIPEEN